MLHWPCAWYLIATFVNHRNSETAGNLLTAAKNVTVGWNFWLQSSHDSEKHSKQMDSFPETLDAFYWDIRFRICNRTQNPKMDFGFPFFRFFPFAFDCKINHRWFVQLCKRIPLKSSQVIWNMLRMWKTCPWGNRNVSNILIMIRLVQLKCH